MLRIVARNPNPTLTLRLAPPLRVVVDNARPEIIIGPTLIDGLGGDVVRLIKRPVSGGKFEFVVEWWERPGAGWTEAPPGAFTPSEIFGGDGWTLPMPVSFRRAAALGIPLDDLAPGTWERPDRSA